MKWNLKISCENLVHTLLFLIHIFLQEKAAFNFTHIWTCLSRYLLDLHFCLLLPAPRVSTTSGTNTIPANLQGSPCLNVFSLNLAWRAWPGLSATRATNLSWRGLTTVTSMAVGLPPDQFGTSKSAGLASEPGLRALSSLRGPRQAVEHVLKRWSSFVCHGGEIPSIS